jgi:hypothetical protein
MAQSETAGRDCLCGFDGGERRRARCGPVEACPLYAGVIQSRIALATASGFWWQTQ